MFYRSDALLLFYIKGESTANRPESGDFFAEKSLPPTPDRCKKKYAEPTRTKDLASGDHYKRSKALSK